MTLTELKLIHGLIVSLAEGIYISHEEVTDAEEILKREIKLREMDPRKGKSQNEIDRDIAERRESERDPYRHDMGE